MLVQIYGSFVASLPRGNSFSTKPTGGGKTASYPEFKIGGSTCVLLSLNFPE
jgi:hypothetical protein